jgi:hypothetical protein
MPDPYNYGVNQIGFENIILTIFALIVIVIFGGAIYTFIRSIIVFIFSHGDEEKINNAMNGIRYMILGVFLSIVFLFLFPYVFQKIRVPGYQIYTAQNIFARAWEIFRAMMDGGKEIGRFYRISNNYGWYTPSIQVSIPNPDLPIQDQVTVNELESDYDLSGIDGEL